MTVLLEALKPIAKHEGCSYAPGDRFVASPVDARYFIHRKIAKEHVGIEVPAQPPAPQAETDMASAVAQPEDAGGPPVQDATPSESDVAGPAAPVRRRGRPPRAAQVAAPEPQVPVVDDETAGLA